jgi:CheY-like chemotaxis protein
MLVDDNELDNFIHSNLIQATRMAENIYVHTGAKSALEFLNNFVRNQHFPIEFLPQIIILDINMPFMDGFQLMDELQKMPSSFTDYLKVVMLSTSTDEKDIKKAKSYPFVIHFAHKPLTEVVLKSL